MPKLPSWPFGNSLPSQPLPADMPAQQNMSHGSFPEPSRNVARVIVHKNFGSPNPNIQDEQEFNRNVDKRIAQILPSIADVAVNEQTLKGAEEYAKELRLTKFRREQAFRTELRELEDIYDMSVPNAADMAVHDGPWEQKLRPVPRKVVLSHYQHEMINYQRMLLRKNIWYYRDRMSVPRGPCPLHVLKECWVQGVIDENTLLWGHGLADWLPAKNIKLLLPMIRTPEVVFGTWFKRTFSLKPALERIREKRSDQRPRMSLQVERMR